MSLDTSIFDQIMKETEAGKRSALSLVQRGGNP